MVVAVAALDAASQQIGEVDTSTSLCAGLLRQQVFGSLETQSPRPTATAKGTDQGPRNSACSSCQGGGEQKPHQGSGSPSDPLGNLTRAGRALRVRLRAPN